MFAAAGMRPYEAMAVKLADPVVETYFDGIDRAAIWHRRAAIAGIVLLVPHIAFAAGPGSAPGAQHGAHGGVLQAFAQTRAGADERCGSSHRSRSAACPRAFAG